MKKIGLVKSRLLFFLILKGEVEQIAMMKPKGQTEHDEGMLEYLEDLIGSGRLKEPIQVLCRRVETLNEQRGEKVSLGKFFVCLLYISQRKPVIKRWNS